MMYEEVLAHQDNLCTKATKTLWKQFRKLGIKIPDDPRTRFGKEDAMGMVLKMSDGKRFARSAARKMRRKAYRQAQEGGRSGRVPSNDWLMKKLAGMDPEGVEKWCQNVMKFMAGRALESGMVQSSTMVGIDLTLVPYYGEALKGRMLKTKAKSGTSYFDAHMTAHSIGPGYEIPLSDTRMTGNDKIHMILLQNIKKIDRAGLHPPLYLLDRGFYSVACIKALKDAGRKFLMPAPKNARIKRLIEAHHHRGGGGTGAASLFSMSNRDFGSVSFNLLIVRKDNYKESDPVTDQYVAFATNLPCRTRDDLVKTIPETYRERWIIETAFRVIKDVKGRTCSNVLHVRTFLFYFALLLYFLWKCTKYADMLQEFLAGGDDFTMAEFMESMDNSVRQLLMWEKHHGNFLKVNR